MTMHEEVTCYKRYNWFVPQQQHSCVPNLILCMCSDSTTLEMQGVIELNHMQLVEEKDTS